jgi:phosphoribosylformylglycinamidine (FGAM) synthase-like amidotransferase family enzyme
MTVDGSAPYGSVCGGIFTILCSILIGASIYYLVQLYNSDHNYIGTFEYTRVLETNGQIFQQNFSTGINLRMAVGSISGRLPGIQNVSSTFTGSNQVLGVIGVQAQIDRTTPTHPIYT